MSGILRKWQVEKLRIWQVHSSKNCLPSSIKVLVTQLTFLCKRFSTLWKVPMSKGVKPRYRTVLIIWNAPSAACRVSKWQSTARPWSRVRHEPLEAGRYLGGLDRFTRQTNRSRRDLVRDVRRCSGIGPPLDSGIEASSFLRPWASDDRQTRRNTGLTLSRRKERCVLRSRSVFEVLNNRNYCKINSFTWIL